MYQPLSTMAMSIYVGCVVVVVVAGLLDPDLRRDPAVALIYGAFWVIWPILLLLLAALRSTPSNQILGPNLDLALYVLCGVMIGFLVVTLGRPSRILSETVVKVEGRSDSVSTWTAFAMAGVVIAAIVVYVVLQ